MNRVLLSAGVFLMMVAGRAFCEEQTFQAPSLDGKRLDLCLVWGSECGQPAADAWCKLQGFDSAKTWTPANDIGAQTPTVVLNGRRVCDQPVCDGFETITCTRATPATRMRPGAPLPSPEPPPPPQPEQPPVVASEANAWRTQDVIDARIDEQAQYALMRMFVGDEAERTDASHILTAVKSGALGGIYQQDQGVPAKRAVKLGIGWWQLLPPGSAKPRIDGVCVREPAGDVPLVVMRKGAQSNKATYDWALRDGWSSCGVASTSPVRPYKVTLPAKQPPAKASACAQPSGLEGVQELYVVVTARQRTTQLAIVQVLGDNPEMKVADLLGVARFTIAKPGFITVVAQPGTGAAVTAFQEDETIFVPTTKSVQVLPGCIHTVGIDLLATRPKVAALR
jgi:hypothetical protein